MQNLLSLLFSSLLLSLLLFLVLSILHNASAARRHQILVSYFAALALLPLGASLIPLLFDSDAYIVLYDTKHENSTIAPPVGSAEWMSEWSQSLATKRQSKIEGQSFGAQVHKLYEKIASRNLFSPARRFFLTEHLPIVLLVFWFTGAVALLIVQLTRWAGAGFIAEMSQDFSPLHGKQESLQSTCNRIARELGFGVQVQVLRSDLAAVAMAWGIRKPYVVLPADSSDWSMEKREGVLRHEMSHIKRRDNLLQALIILICAAYWPNPLVWAALRRLHFEREVACDDTAIRCGTLPSTYAKHLMEIAMKLSGPKSNNVVPALMAHSSNMKKRLKIVLNPNIDRRPLPRMFTVICLALAILAAAPLSILRLWNIDSLSSEARAERWSASRVESLASREDTRFDLYFNGGNTHVVIPDNDVFDFPASFTLEAKVNVAALDQSGQNVEIISKHRSHVNDAGEWAWTIMGSPNPVGQMKFLVWSGESSYTANSDPGVILPSGDHCVGWQNLSFSYSAETSQWWMFVDGQIVGSGSALLNIGNTDRDVWIGWESNEPSHNFYGWMREVRISNSCLYTGPYSPAEQLGVETSTLAYYSFSEGEGLSLVDQSGNGHDGTIHNGTWDVCLGENIVVEPGTNLQDVVDAAPDGASILLLPGHHYGPVVFDGRTLSLCGSGVDQTVLDANFYDYAILLTGSAEISLCDLAVMNCFNDDPVEYYYPAALTIDNGFASVEHCLFENNLNAVGAWRSNSQIELFECSVLAGDAFGFMTREAEASTRISFTNCTLVGERTTADHGLVKMWGGSIVANQSVLSTPEGRAIEYHSGTWEGHCNVVYATTQVGGGLVLPQNHWNIDPLLQNREAWGFLVDPNSPTLPANNDCGLPIGAIMGATAIREIDWGQLKTLY